MLTQDSMIGLLSSILTHLDGEGIKLNPVLEKMVKSKNVGITITPNLKKVAPTTSC
jgi:hypothetical protein